jgi:hypothetical protein
MVIHGEDMSTSFKEIDTVQKRDKLVEEINDLKSQLAILVQEAKKEVKVTPLIMQGLYALHNGERVFELKDTQAVVHSGDVWVIFSSEDPTFFFVGKTLGEAFIKMIEYIINEEIEFIKDHVLNYRFPLSTRESQELYRDELKERIQTLERLLNILRWARNGELRYILE